MTSNWRPVDVLRHIAVGSLRDEIRGKGWHVVAHSEARRDGGWSITYLFQQEASGSIVEASGVDEIDVLSKIVRAITGEKSREVIRAVSTAKSEGIEAL